MFSEKLLELREENRLTQAEMSERLGVAPSSYSAYEGGRIIPKIDFLMRACHEFGVTPNYLLNFSDRIDGKQPTSYSTFINLVFSLMDYFGGTPIVGTCKEVFPMVALDIRPVPFEGKYGLIFFDDDNLRDILESITKMLPLLQEGTISQEIFDTWVEGQKAIYSVPIRPNSKFGDKERQALLDRLSEIEIYSNPPGE